MSFLIVEMSRKCYPNDCVKRHTNKFHPLYMFAFSIGNYKRNIRSTFDAIASKSLFFL